MESLVSWISNNEWYFTAIIAAFVVHIVLAVLESNEIRWLIHLRRHKAIMWHIIVWLIPYIGVAVARSTLHLPKTKGDVETDTSTSHIQPFD